MAANSTPVRDIYNRVCWDLCEDFQLQLGIVTDAEFLGYLEEAILEFCMQVGLVKKIFTQSIFLSQSQYLIPDDLLKVQAAFVGGVYIERVSLEELYNTGLAWPNEVGPPTSWFADGLPEGTIQLVPIPDLDGTPISGPQPPFGAYGEFLPEDNNLTTVAPAGPTLPLSLTLDSDIPSEVPDSFTPYLVYRVHWRIASMDGEAKDLQRARYCDARWKEGIALGQAIMMEVIADAQ